MAEEIQETKDQETMRGPKEVTTKDPRRVEQGRKLQEHNCRRKEEWAVQKSTNQYVIRAVIAVGLIEGLGYCLYQAKKGEVNVEPPQPPQRSCPKFEMD